MDFGDLFSSDSLGALGTVLGVGSGLYNQSRLRGQYGNTVNTLNDIYAPTGGYAQQLEKQLAARDAAAGRNSQYGPRLAQLYGTLAQEKARALNSPNYQQLLQGASRGNLSTLTGALGKANNARKLYNFASGLYNQGLSGPASLGGASSALEGGFGSFGGAGGFGGSGNLLGSTEGIGGIFGPAGEAGGATMGVPDLGGGWGLSSLFGPEAGAGAGAEAATPSAFSGLSDMFSGLGSSLGFDSGATAGAAAGGAGEAGAAGAGSLGAAGFLGPLGLFAGGMLLASSGGTSGKEAAGGLANIASGGIGGLENSLSNASSGFGTGSYTGALPWDTPTDPNSPIQSWDQYAASIPGRLNANTGFDQGDWNNIKQYYDWASQNQAGITNALNTKTNFTSGWGDN